MSSLLAFAGSNSSTSINFKLVNYTVSLVKGHQIGVLNMANYPFPIYSADHEKENGFSNSLVELKNDIMNSDGLIISVNEHNSNPSAYFKNLIDWLSRLEHKFLEEKKILLMSTSGGRRGGVGSLEVVKNMLPRFGAQTIITFSLPQFHENFSVESGIIDEDLAKEHKRALNDFLKAL